MPALTFVRFTVVTVVGASLLVPAPGLAASTPWEPRGPEGGDVRSLALHPTEPNLVLAAASEGVLRSEDGGDTWTLSRQPKIDLLEAHPLGGRVYGWTHGALYASGDWGLSWERLAEDFDGVHEIALDPTDPRVLFLGGHDGLWFSDDGGVSWVDRSPHLDESFVCGLAVDAAGDLFVGAYRDGLARSSDDGLTFVDPNPGDQRTLGRLVASPAMPGLLLGIRDSCGTQVGPDATSYRVTEGGATWTAISHDGLASFDFAPSDPDVVYAAELDGLAARSTDAGATWTAVDSGLWGGNGHAVAVHADDADAIVLGHSLRGVFVSEDAGTTWAATGPTGIPVPVDEVAVAPSDPDMIYAGTSGGVWASTDGGASWVGTPLPGPWCCWQVDLAVDEADPQVAYAAFEYHHEVFRTVDGGRSWQTLSCCALPPQPRGVASIETAAGEVHVATTHQGVFSSLDEGATWTNRSVGLVPHPRTGYGEWFGLILAMTADPWSGGLALVTMENLPDPYARPQVYTSLPRALAWERTERFDEMCEDSCLGHWEIEATGPATLYAGLVSPYGCYAGWRNEAFRTTDGGGSWSPATEGLDGQLVRFLPGPAAGETLAATCDDGLFVTQGQGWSRFADGPPSDQLIGIERGPDGRLWAATPDGLYTLDT